MNFVFYYLFFGVLYYLGFCVFEEVARKRKTLEREFFLDFSVFKLVVVAVLYVPVTIYGVARILKGGK